MNSLHPLRAYRKKAGKRLEDLAAAVGASKSTISRIENGELWPNRELMQRLKQATGGTVTAEDFLHGATK